MGYSQKGDGGKRRGEGGKGRAGSPGRGTRFVFFTSPNANERNFKFQCMRINVSETWTQLPGKPLLSTMDPMFVARPVELEKLMSASILASEKTYITSFSLDLPSEGGGAAGGRGGPEWGGAGKKHHEVGALKQSTFRTSMLVSCTAVSDRYL